MAAFGKIFVTALGLTCVLASTQAYLLGGRLRDFKMRGTAGGHPDFEWQITGVKTGMLGPLFTTMLNGAGNPVYTATPDYGGVTSAATFDQWYNDDAAWNLPMDYSIDLAYNVVGNYYEYSNSSFFPLDGLLFGNQGHGHNYAFTYEIAATFKYQVALNQYFEFTGDDDVWAFFNNRLAIDLGGVHPAANASINLNAHAAALGLVDGQTYSMNFFFAERHTSQSNFRIKTNIGLDTTPQAVPEPFTMALMGSAALVGVRKIRAKRNA